MSYIEIAEHCGNEGETWATYLVEEGNETFLEKLRATLEKFPDLKGSDTELELSHPNTALEIVDEMVKRTRSGYYDFYSKCDEILDPSIIDDSNEDAFVDSFYKRKYFENN